MWPSPLLYEIGGLEHAGCTNIDGQDDGVGRHERIGGDKHRAGRPESGSSHPEHADGEKPYDNEGDSSTSPLGAPPNDLIQGLIRNRRVS